MPTAAVLGVTSLFGAVSSKKAGDKAARATNAASAAAASQTQQSANQAREDVNRLFPQAQETARQGFQGALDVFGQSLPAQSDVFQQGNLGAQQAILQGLPQIQNALLGGNVDLSQLQPFQVQQPNLGFFNQQLPESSATRAAQQQSMLDASSVGPVQNFTPNMDFSGSILGGGSGLSDGRFQFKQLI